MIYGDIQRSSSDAGRNRRQTLRYQLSPGITQKERELRGLFDVPGFMLKERQRRVCVARRGEDGC
jgi:hypothetical protein